MYMYKFINNCTLYFVRDDKNKDVQSITNSWLPQSGISLCFRNYEHG